MGFWFRMYTTTSADGSGRVIETHAEKVEPSLTARRTPSPAESTRSIRFVKEGYVKETIDTAEQKSQRKRQREEEEYMRAESAREDA